MLADFEGILKTALPLKQAPLVHCLTNAVTIETMANALLYIGAQPIMADYPPEFEDVCRITDSLLLNLGHLGPGAGNVLAPASHYAHEVQKPTLVDIVGISATQTRYDLAQKLFLDQPAVLKGNISELRAFTDLPSHGRGVDGSALDQGDANLIELAKALCLKVKADPTTTFMATGPVDLIVNGNQALVLENGVAQLDRFTGTGDVVGALTAALLGVGLNGWQASVCAITYFNLCGEQAARQLTPPFGEATFRLATLDQLSLLMTQPTWYQQLTGHFIDIT